MNISANILCQSYFMPIIFRANQISGKDEWMQQSLQKLWYAGELWYDPGEGDDKK